MAVAPITRYIKVMGISEMKVQNAEDALQYMTQGEAIYCNTSSYGPLPGPYIVTLHL